MRSVSFGQRRRFVRASQIHKITEPEQHHEEYHRSKTRNKQPKRKMIGLGRFLANRRPRGTQLQEMPESRTESGVGERTLQNEHLRGSKSGAGTKYHATEENKLTRKQRKELQASKKPGTPKRLGTPKRPVSGLVDSHNLQDQELQELYNNLTKEPPTGLEDEVPSTPKFGRKLSFSLGRMRSSSFNNYGQESSPRPPPLASSDMFVQSTSSGVQDFGNEQDESEQLLQSRRTMSSFLALSGVFFPEQDGDEESTKMERQKSVVTYFSTEDGSQKDVLSRKESSVFSQSECDETDTSLIADVMVHHHMPIDEVEHPTPQDNVHRDMVHRDTVQQYHISTRRVTTAESSYDADTSNADYNTSVASTKYDDMTLGSKSTKATSHNSSMDDDDEEFEKAHSRVCSSFTLQDGFRAVITLLKRGDDQCGRCGGTRHW